MVSIIIRTRNEERWIGKCLDAVAKQDYPDFEIIIVDNCSTDNTLKIAKELGFNRIVTINQFNYSAALNKGIEITEGKLIACLSGHCIPTSNQWLSNLARNFDIKYVAGVYGRQEPLAKSSNLDKRDLWLTFGLDKKIQKVDPFFHNANSMIRRELWERYKFDESMQGQEDRAWAKKMIDMGKVIIYEPEASVYHYHGIHHDRDKDRCDRVVKQMGKIK